MTFRGLQGVITSPAQPILLTSNSPHRGQGEDFRVLPYKTGADDFARILGLISSAALYGVSSFDAFGATSRGNSVLSGVDGTVAMNFYEL